MFTVVAGILSPLVLLILGGFFMASFFTLSEETLVRVVSDFFMPLLIFEALYRSRVSADAVGQLAAAAIIVLVVLLLVTVAYAALTGVDRRAFGLPVLFMNSGFLGIPLMQLWGGAGPMNLIIIYDQVSTMFLFTLGIFMAAGGFSSRGLRGVATSPMLWALAAAFLLRFLDVPLPELLLSSFEFAGNAAPPVAAFTLGASLAHQRIRLDVHMVAGVVLRFFGGLAAALLAAWILGLQGELRVVVIVASALPAAVMSYVLPVRFGSDPSHARSVVVVSTFLSFFWIPVAFHLAGAL
ncbi:MAG: AEC family transporter [Spirochaetaceae bacterium]